MSQIICKGSKNLNSKRFCCRLQSSSGFFSGSVWTVLSRFLLSYPEIIYSNRLLIKVFYKIPFQLDYIKMTKSAKLLLMIWNHARKRKFILLLILLPSPRFPTPIGSSNYLFKIFCENPELNVINLSEIKLFPLIVSIS